MNKPIKINFETPTLTAENVARLPSFSLVWSPREKFILACYAQG